jgi:hypothetical protein
MIHNSTDNGGHYGVSLEADKRGILIQLGANSEQAWNQLRILLTAGESAHLADLLNNAAERMNHEKETKAMADPGRVSSAAGGRA